MPFQPPHLLGIAQLTADDIETLLEGTTALGYAGPTENDAALGAAQALAAQHGAKNISAVSGNLNILVAGEKAGSILKKATAVGTVEIMTEQDFLDLIG